MTFKSYVVLHVDENAITFIVQLFFYLLSLGLFFLFFVFFLFVCSNYDS